MWIVLFLELFLTHNCWQTIVKELKYPCFRSKSVDVKCPRYLPQLNSNSCNSSPWRFPWAHWVSRCCREFRSLLRSSCLAPQIYISTKFGIQAASQGILLEHSPTEFFAWRFTYYIWIHSKSVTSSSHHFLLGFQKVSPDHKEAKPLVPWEGNCWEQLQGSLLIFVFLGPLQGLEPDKKVNTSCVFTVCLQRGVCMELDLVLRLLLSYFQGSHMQRVTAKEEPWVSFWFVSETHSFVFIWVSKLPCGWAPLKTQALSISHRYNQSERIKCSKLSLNCPLLGIRVRAKWKGNKESSQLETSPRSLLVLEEHSPSKDGNYKTVRSCFSSAPPSWSHSCPQWPTRSPANPARLGQPQAHWAEQAINSGPAFICIPLRPPTQLHFFLGPSLLPPSLPAPYLAGAQIFSSCPLLIGWSHEPASLLL